MRKKILIIEDEVELVEMLKVRLEPGEYDIISAYDGEEGLEKAKKDNPDLILLDLILPKVDGYQVCGILKKDKKYSHIPIVMFSARAKESDIKLGKELGADGYITKPFEPSVLLAKIKGLI